MNTTLVVAGAAPETDDANITTSNPPASEQNERGMILMRFFLDCLLCIQIDSLTVRLAYTVAAYVTVWSPVAAYEVGSVRLIDSGGPARRQEFQDFRRNIGDRLVFSLNFLIGDFGIQRFAVSH